MEMSLFGDTDRKPNFLIDIDPIYIPTPEASGGYTQEDETYFNNNPNAVDKTDTTPSFGQQLLTSIFNAAPGVLNVLKPNANQIHYTPPKPKPTNNTALLLTVGLVVVFVIILVIFLVKRK